MNDILIFLQEKLKQNDTIIVACSAGPDSMCLINIINSLKESLKLNIICAHVNHKMRKESELEAEYVKNYCADNNIIFEYLIIEEYNKENFQNQARNKRYEFFENLTIKYSAKYLMTAHHADDLMETILMRITRGSKLKGYAGFKMESKKDKYTLIRPLISVTKEEIIKYNEENNIDYYIDVSNFENKYTRNRYRDKIITFLKKEDKNVHQKFLKFQKVLLDYEQFIDEIIIKDFKNIYKNNTLLMDIYNKQEDLIQTKIIERILNEIFNNDLYLINDTHIVLIKDLIKNKKVNSKIDLPNGIVATKTYDKIYFGKEKNNYSFEYELKDKIILPNNDEIFYSKEEDDTNFCIRINSKEISLPIIIRNRFDGDKMIVKNLNGHKKINDIFIDEKISKSQREQWPIVCDSKGNILWLPGLKKSKFDKDKKEIYDIIIKYVKKERK